MSGLIRETYTIMAGCGVGEFLWHKNSSDKCLVGRNVFNQMDSAHDQELISEGLFNELWGWAGEFMAGQSNDLAEPWQIEWDVFNARGMELARMLKEELGQSVDVQYVPAKEDRREATVLGR